MPQKPQKIAVVRVNALGDFIFVLPALQALRSTFPETEIVYLGKLWHAAYLSNRPSPVDRIIVAPKVAGVGGFTLYHTQKLRSAGGFDFYQDLPVEHCGEDVLAQQKVMAKFGGCGVLPSGVYHQELPTTLPHRENNAPEMLTL